MFAAFYYTGLSTLGVVVGFAIVALAFDREFDRSGSCARAGSSPWPSSSLILSIILAALFFARERQARDAEAELERERLRAERVEREAALANLRALQAQIEPHFLFNTLANVASLIDPDPTTAKRMLESFIRFLRASLTATRTESDHARAPRPSSSPRTCRCCRCAWARGCASASTCRAGAARRSRLPPMLLQPVVENAIRHGLEPKVEGGERRVARAPRRRATSVIEIADTGVGFQPTTRGGVGLSNLRDRLRLLYGERASLTDRRERARQARRSP